MTVLVDEAVDLGGEREGGAGGHRVLEVAHGAPRVLLELVGGHVVCGRSLSDFVFSSWVNQAANRGASMCPSAVMMPW